MVKWYNRSNWPGQVMAVRWLMATTWGCLESSLVPTDWLDWDLRFNIAISWLWNTPTQTKFGCRRHFWCLKMTIKVLNFSKTSNHLGIWSESSQTVGTKELSRHVVAIRHVTRRDLTGSIWLILIESIWPIQPWFVTGTRWKYYMIIR